MATISKSTVDSELRSRIFDDLGMIDDHPAIEFEYQYVKINDRQYGVLITDANGKERYVRIGVIVAEEREDMTARELMNKEIEDYNLKVAKREEKAKAKAEKAKADKEKREENMEKSE